MSDHADVDYEAFYKERCHRVKCRINSAVANTLAKASFKPLTAIILRENYVGSKGVLPILALLEVNQTVEVIDLSHNGMDNASVAELCRIAKVHKGVTGIDISSNNLTQSVGKELVGLVESNPRIVELRAEGNGLYKSLLSRVALCVGKNRSLQPDLPQVETIRALPPSQDLGGPALRQQSSQNGTPASAVDDQQSGDERWSPRPSARNRVKPCPVPPPTASQGHRRMTPQERDAARENYHKKLRCQNDPVSAYLPHSQQGVAPSIQAKRKLEALQREQAEEEGGGASVNEAARSQNRTLQQHANDIKMSVSQRVSELFPDDADGGDDLFAPTSGQQVHPSAALSQDSLKMLEKQGIRIARAEVQQYEAAQMRQRLSAAENERDKLVEAQGHLAIDTGAASPGAATPTHQESQAGSNLPTPRSTDAGVRPPPSSGSWARSQQELQRAACCEGPPQGAREGEGVGVRDGGISEPKATVMSVPEGVDEDGLRFYDLFNQGGKAYNGGRLEEAYEAWVSALEVATVCKNREWVSIINGNIQALSYQLLSGQGDDHLERNELEEALRCLQLARDLAHKARNTSWERAAESRMDSVRRAQFKTCFDAANQSFEPLVRDMEERLQDERTTSFCMSRVAHPQPGSKPPPETPGPFDKEWGRVQALQETLDQWLGALEYASHVTHRNGKCLLDMVTSAVHVAFECQLAWTLSPAEDLKTKHCSQGANRFTAPQRDSLIVMWEKIHDTLLSLNSPEWLALTWSILGNLHHSVFHNKIAEECFKKSMALASESGSTIIEASSCTDLARVHVGLSRYSEAEKLLVVADQTWAELRAAYLGTQGAVRRTIRGQVVPQKGVDRAVSPCEGSPREYQTKAGQLDEGDRDKYLFERNALFAIYTVQQQHSLYDMMQQIMVSQFRYREGLEMAERMRSLSSMDKLDNKMQENFNTKTTSDHMLSLARSSQSVLVIYSSTIRFDWDVDQCEAIPYELLYIWVMPPEGEIKFVLINVTQDYNGASIESILDSLREALCVETDSDRARSGKAASTGVIVDSPAYAWKHPLQQLYDFMIYPISDFLMVNAGLEFAPHRKVMFVPHGVLHLVPWAALMDTNGRFFIESFNIQVTSSVQILALAKLNATKLGSEAQKLVVISGPSERPKNLPYTFDDPLEEESAGVAESLGVAPVSCGRESICMALSGARLIHIAAEVLAEYAEGTSWGGVVVADGAVSSKQIEVSELSAELVVAPACNHSKEALLRGGDGVLGLCRAFACAGVSSILYSLWATPHQSSAQLLGRFYNNLKTQPDKAIALSQAQRHACTTDPYGPASWASLYLFGMAT